MGAMITVVAAYGYHFVAHVANIAAPWMTLVFVAFGIVGLRQLGDRTSARRRLWQQAADARSGRAASRCRAR